MFKENSKKKLLALDGGGIRGILTLQILRKIEQILREARQNSELVLSDYFDYIGGTSTGGIIAAALAIGLSVDEIEKYYFDQASAMFSPTANIFKRLLVEKYDAEALRQQLQHIFGVDTTLGSKKLKTLLLLIMMNASTSSPWPVSSNPNAKYNDLSLGDDCNLNIPLWQLVRASAAAPYFFEPENVKVGSQNFLFYDGALTSLNNPAFKLFQMATLPEYRLGWPVGSDNMLLVSVGTGLLSKEMKSLKFKEAQVVNTMLTAMQSLMFTGTVEQDFLCRGLGKCIVGDPIDGEVGDMINRASSFTEPLFSYIRYNADLSLNGLKSIGCEKLAGNHFHIDDISAMNTYKIIGEAVACSKVKSEHFTSNL